MPPSILAINVTAMTKIKKIITPPNLILSAMAQWYSMGENLPQLDRSWTIFASSNPSY